MTTQTATFAKARGGKPLAKAPTPIKISEDCLRDLKEVFKLLSDGNRLKILIALSQDGEMHVTALCDMLGQSQPAVSHHLTLLRARRLVGYRRDGKHNYYRLECGSLTKLLEEVFANCGNGHRQIQLDQFALAFKKTK